MAPARLCVLRASAGSPQVLPRSRGLPQRGQRAGEAETGAHGLAECRLTGLNAAGIVSTWFGLPG